MCCRSLILISTCNTDEYVHQLLACTVLIVGLENGAAQGFN